VQYVILLGPQLTPYVYVILFIALLISAILRVIFGDYITLCVFDIKHLAEEDTEVFRRAFHKFPFAFKERIHNMENGKQIVLVVSVVNEYYLLFLFY
jgi:hypothetical protein